MHPVLHQVHEIEHRITSIQRMTLRVAKWVMAFPRRQRKPRRTLTVAQMHDLERGGVRQAQIAAEAGITERQVRSLLSQIRTRPNGRPRGSFKITVPDVVKSKDGTKVGSMKLSSALRAKQRDLGLTTNQLAKRLKVAAPGLYRIVAGTASPNSTTAKKYAKFLGMSAEKLQSLAQAVPRKIYTRRKK